MTKKCAVFPLTNYYSHMIKSNCGYLCMISIPGCSKTPIVLARGVPYARHDGAARDRLRPKDKDLFR